MKRIFLMVFAVLLSTAALWGGVFLITGCSKSNENSTEISAPDTSSGENSSAGEVGENEGDGADLGSDLDDSTEANATYYLRFYTKYTNYTSSSTLQTNASKYSGTTTDITSGSSTSTSFVTFKWGTTSYTADGTLRSRSSTSTISLTVNTDDYYFLGWIYYSVYEDTDNDDGYNYFYYYTFISASAGTTSSSNYYCSRSGSDYDAGFIAYFSSVRYNLTFYTASSSYTTASSFQSYVSSKSGTTTNILSSSSSYYALSNVALFTCDNTYSGATRQYYGTSSGYTVTFSTQTSVTLSLSNENYSADFLGWIYYYITEDTDTDEQTYFYYYTYISSSTGSAGSTKYGMHVSGNDIEAGFIAVFRQTRVLTINYYKRCAANTSGMLGTTLSATAGTFSSSGITSVGSSVTLTWYYGSTVTLTASTTRVVGVGTSYKYYITVSTGTSDVVTSSSDLESTTYAWDCEYSTTVYVCIYQRMTMSIYYSGYYSNSTNLSISATSGTLSASSVSSSSTAVVATLYQPHSISTTLTFSRANTSYTYYVTVDDSGTGTTATTSSPTNSTTYTWSPTADLSVYVQLRERMSCNIYYTGYYTNSTNISLSISSTGALAASSLSTGGSTTAYVPYRLSDPDITITRANTSYTYYITAETSGTAATTSSPTNTTTYEWDSRSSISLYVRTYQRYTITYNTNNGTGTLPTTPQYKPHSVSATLGTNSLTRTGYIANGWNTASDGTGTSYADGASYTGNANVTMYANWTADYSDVYVVEFVQTSLGVRSYKTATTSCGTVSYSFYEDVKLTPTLYTESTTGGSDDYSLKGYTFSITGVTVSSGYALVGFSYSTGSTVLTAISTSTNSSYLPTQTQSEPSHTYSVTPSTTYVYIYVFFNLVSDNQLQYDSSEGYWYFEDGEFPQTYYGTSVSGLSSTASYTLTIGGVSVPVYALSSNSSKKYAKVTIDGVTAYFTVEPIRWVVAYGSSYPSGWEYWADYSEEFYVVSAKVLTYGCVSSDLVSEGWVWTDGDLFSETKTNAKAVASSLEYAISDGNTYQMFGDGTTQNNIVVTYPDDVETNATNGWFAVASVTSISGRGSYVAKCTDLVAFIASGGYELTGDYAMDYWTSSLSCSSVDPQLNNGVYVTASGSLRNAYLDQYFGARFYMAMSEGSRIVG